MTPEGRIKARVKRALATLNKHCYRFMPVQNGMGAPSLDFLNCIYGKFVGIETKAPGKRLTPRQEITAGAIRDAGGLVFVIDSDSSIDHMMAVLENLRGPPDNLEGAQNNRCTPGSGSAELVP